MLLFIQLAGYLSEFVHMPSHWSTTGYPRAYLRQQNLSVFSTRKRKNQVSLDWRCSGASVPCRGACCSAASEDGSRAGSVLTARTTHPCSRCHICPTNRAGALPLTPSCTGNVPVTMDLHYRPSLGCFWDAVTLLYGTGPCWYQWDMRAW